MAYVRSLREIPLTEEPHLSVLNALIDAAESPYMAGPMWHEASAYQLAHLRACPACAEYLGGIGILTVGQPQIGSGTGSI